MKKFLIPIFLFSVVFLISAAPPILRQFGTTNTPTALTNIIQSLAGGGSQVWTNDGTFIQPTVFKPVLLGGNPINDIMQDTGTNWMPLVGSVYQQTNDTVAKGRFAPFQFITEIDDLHDGRLGAVQMLLYAKTNEIFWNAQRVITLDVESQSGTTNRGKSIYDSGKGNILFRAIDNTFRGNANPQPFESIGIQSVSYTDAGRQYGVDGYIYLDTPGNGYATNSQNAAIVGVVENVLGAANAVSAAGFFELGSSLTTDPVMENSALLLDVRTTHLPLITARTNNGTHVSQLDADGAWTSLSYKATRTNAFILPCPDGGSFILTVKDDGTLNVVTNTTRL